MMAGEGLSKCAALAVGILLQRDVGQRFTHPGRRAKRIGAHAEIQNAGRVQAEACQLGNIRAAVLDGRGGMLTCSRKVGWFTHHAGTRAAKSNSTRTSTISQVAP